MNNKSPMWLDTWASSNHVEVYFRYNTPLKIQDCFGFGLEVLPKTFGVNYNSWRCRFYFSIWFIAFWIDFPRMKMLYSAYEGKRLLDKNSNR